MRFWDIVMTAATQSGGSAATEPLLALSGDFSGVLLLSPASGSDSLALSGS